MLEGKLKPGYRHVYSKRVMFIDEDTGHAASGDFYDARGQLWQHGEINYYYAYDIKKWHAGNLVLLRLECWLLCQHESGGERPKAPILGKDNPRHSQYTPEAIRNLGN